MLSHLIFLLMPVEPEYDLHLYRQGTETQGDYVICPRSYGEYIVSL